MRRQSGNRAGAKQRIPTLGGEFFTKRGQIFHLLNVRAMAGYGETLAQNGKTILAAINQQQFQFLLAEQIQLVSVVLMVQLHILLQVEQLLIHIH